jgi:hypothetical protein
LERLDSLRYERRIHMNTVTINLVKCKRPASSLLDDMDYEIEQGTGRLTRLTNHNLPSNMLHKPDDVPVVQQLELADFGDW